MDKHIHQHIRHLFPLAYGWIGMLSVTLAGGGYYIYTLRTHLTTISNDLASTKEMLASTTQTLDISHKHIITIEEEKSHLIGDLQTEQAKNQSYETQISTISATVSDLYKLSQTDKELLQKYSRVYFLNENYIPASLSEISTEYLARPEKPEKIHTTVKSYLEHMIRDARNSNIPLSVLSGYRSYGTQANLKASYKVQYGTTAANKFSADQGYSEHQLGSTIDFTTPKNGDNLDAFEKSSAYPWLLENAHRYGFILSYPKGNTYYTFEPWHWRFVGVELATKLYTEKKYFYDFDQREINTYLSKIFN